MPSWRWSIWPAMPRPSRCRCPISPPGRKSRCLTWNSFLPACAAPGWSRACVDRAAAIAWPTARRRRGWRRPAKDRQVSAASVYLDHNATSPLRPAAFDAIAGALKAGGNPSSVHKSGRAARGRIDAARRQVAALVGALPAEVVFTSGGTEANNLALKGAGRRVMASAVEHDSVLKAGPCKIIPVDRNGIVDLAALERLLAGSKEPAPGSGVLANNETGVRQPTAAGVPPTRPAGPSVPCRGGPS